MIALLDRHHFERVLTSMLGACNFIHILVDAPDSNACIELETKYHYNLYYKAGYILITYKSLTLNFPIWRSKLTEVYAKDTPNLYSRRTFKKRF